MAERVFAREVATLISNARSLAPPIKLAWVHFMNSLLHFALNQHTVLT